jgi:hypothetical protein
MTISLLDRRIWIRELQKINYPIFGIKTIFSPPAPCPLLPVIERSRTPLGILLRAASRREVLPPLPQELAPIHRTILQRQFLEFTKE